MTSEVRFLIEREGMDAREACKAAGVPLWMAEIVEHDMAQQRTQDSAEAQHDAYVERQLTRGYEIYVMDEHDEELDRVDKMLAELSRQYG